MNSSKLQWIGLAAWCGMVATAVVACGGGGGGGDGGSAAPGSMRFAMTDAPACGYDHVWVTVEKVSVNPSSGASDTDAGWTDLTISPARRIDLLALTNGVLEELGTVPLAAGHYSQVRLVLSSNAGTNPPANAVQPTGGPVTALTTPSGQQSGVKLKVNADVASGQMADLVLDFDACKSVVKAGNSGQYVLKPVISVVPRTVTGIQGAVATSLPLGSTTISAQQDGAVVRSTAPDATTGQFSIPFLAAGTYTLVITSDAHATGVVTSVPAGTTTTVVGTTGAPITLPTSSMADVTGTVSASTLSNGNTVTTAVTDATLRALQSLTGGPQIEVASQPVDATAGTYHFRLPMAAPVKGAYAGTTTVTLSPDTAAAGKYTIEASAPTRATLTKPADVSSSSSAQVNFGY